jgi:YD repeat-containing protein
MRYPGSTPQALTAYNANNQWTGAGYDLAGNQTALPSGSFTFDAENRMTSATESNMPSISYSYDGEGQRVSKTVGSATTIFYHLRL